MGFETTENNSILQEEKLFEVTLWDLKPVGSFCNSSSSDNIWSNPMGFETFQVLAYLANVRTFEVTLWDLKLAPESEVFKCSIEFEVTLWDLKLMQATM